MGCKTGGSVCNREGATVTASVTEQQQRNIQI